MSAPWTATVLTIFPEMFPGPLGHSLAGKALAEGRWKLATVDIRDFARDSSCRQFAAVVSSMPAMAS